MKQMALTHPELFEKQQFLDNEAARSLGSRNNHRAAIAPFTLPVVVHIIHQGATGNISDAQVLQGIQHLNEAYSNTGYYNQVTGVNTQVQFCLAKRSPEGTPTTGINRVESPLTSMNMNTQDLRRNIGYVIQQIGLFPNMTIEENIAVVPKLLGWDKARYKERARELMRMIALEPDAFLKRFPSELSGGQQQRIGVARALAADPPVMLMDEPFGAIDPINRAVIQDEFLKMQQDLKKTIMFVSHDIDEAIKMGDIDIVLADTSGRLHTNCDLMDELAGIKKSIGKRMEGSPHEVALVLDGTTGLNMLNQAREFNKMVDVTGIILTKLDGTSKGGAVVSVVDELGVPVKFVGVGEAIDDLQTFDPVSFVDALFPDDPAE